MANAITITIDDARVLAVLARMANGLDDPEPLLRAWGEDLVESTKQRFAAGAAPDGSRWAPNTEATYLAYLHRLSGSYGKDGQRTGVKRGYEDKAGRVAARGSAAVVSKKPLIGEGKSLSTQIHYRTEGHTLFVGSPQVYAAMQQFGGEKAEFPNLWGDIPARPFLGISDSDAEGMERTAVDYLAQLANG